MKKIIYLFIATLTLQLASCGNSELDTWDSSFVWFTDTLIDFTNKAQPDVSEGGTLTIAVPLTVASKVSGQDRTVNVEIAEQPRDSRTKVTVPAQATIRAGSTEDTLYVSLVNSSHLDEVYDTLALRIIPSDDFLPGLEQYQTVRIALHNGYQRPSWWNSSCEYYFGYFTQLKMEVFVAVTGGTDDPRSNKGASYWSSSDLAVQYLTYVLNDYIEANNIRYPDDDPNAPGEQPVFDFWSY